MTTQSILDSFFSLIGARAVRLQFDRLARCIAVVLLATTLAACGASGAREAELAAQEAARVAAEQEAARVAQAQERQRATELQRQREAQEAERARLAAAQERREREEQRRIEAERMAQQEAERRERQRLAAIAAAEAEREEKLSRIEELEAQLVAATAATGRNEAAAEFLAEAVATSEELLEVLTAEQAKYEDTDAAGMPVQALAKERIAELQALKAELERQARLQ